MKWKQALSQTGMQESELSAKIKKVISAFNDLVDEEASIKSQLSSGTASPQLKAQLEEEYSEVVEAIETLDEQLVLDVNKFFKNKDRYAEMADKMAKGRAAKKASKSAPAPAPAPSPAPQPVSAPAPAPAEPVVETDDKDKKKGGMGLGTAVLGIGLLVLSFGAYNHFKNR
jgi:uncharacterized membrane protein